MNNSTPEQMSPREDTLKILRLFARFYHPGSSAATDGTPSLSFFEQAETAVC